MSNESDSVRRLLITDEQLPLLVEYRPGKGEYKFYEITSTRKLRLIMQGAKSIKRLFRCRKS